jgi:hypothetical protein
LAHGIVSASGIQGTRLVEDGTKAGCAGSSNEVALANRPKATSQESADPLLLVGYHGTLQSLLTPHTVIDENIARTFPMPWCAADRVPLQAR